MSRDFLDILDFSDILEFSDILDKLQFVTRVCSHYAKAYLISLRQGLCGVTTRARVKQNQGVFLTKEDRGHYARACGQVKVFFTSLRAPGRGSAKINYASLREGLLGVAMRARRLILHHCAKVYC